MALKKVIELVNKLLALIREFIINNLKQKPKNMSDSELIDSLKTKLGEAMHANSDLKNELVQSKNIEDNLNSQISFMSEKLERVTQSNYRLHETIDNMQIVNDRLKSAKTEAETKGALNPNELIVGQTVTPLESHLHFEKGYNARVDSVSPDKKTMNISNLDNRETHKESTEVPTNLFRLIGIFILFLFSYCISAQSDSTTVISDSSKSVIEGILSILEALGFKVTPFTGIITGSLLFIIRLVEKRIMKRKIASEIKQTVYNSNAVNDMEVDNKQGVFRKLLDKLEGKKQEDKK